MSVYSQLETLLFLLSPKDVAYHTPDNQLAQNIAQVEDQQIHNSHPNP
jgi:hypothetical protein